MPPSVLRPSSMVPARTRVLVVEDNEDARELFGMVLEREGYAVRLAASASEAIAVASEFLPAVVLTDISLPDLDGFELAERLRQLPALEPCRLVAVTGHSGAAVDQQVKAAGFAALVTKPARFETLLAAVAGDELMAASAG